MEGHRGQVASITLVSMLGTREVPRSLSSDFAAMAESSEGGDRTLFSLPAPPGHTLPPRIPWARGKQVKGLEDRFEAETLMMGR